MDRSLFPKLRDFLLDRKEQGCPIEVVSIDQRALVYNQEGDDMLSETGTGVRWQYVGAD